MAIATKVLECEYKNMKLLTIQDDTGAVWRYAQRGNLELDTAPHVKREYYPPVIRAVLVRDANGVAILRQDNPGLPAKIVVDHILPSSHGPMSGMSHWQGKAEYEQESEKIVCKKISK